jgi:membrane-bound metal-dependent hydrolase YbcI (DUF457 family)
MTQLLYKFTLQSAKFHPAVLICVALVWLTVIGCAITSINSQPFTPRQRNFWIVVVTIFPIIGLLAYLPFSFRKEDLPQLFLSKRHKRGGAIAVKFEAAYLR